MSTTEENNSASLAAAYVDLCHQMAELSALVDEFICAEGNIFGKDKAEAYERLLVYLERRDQ